MPDSPDAPCGEPPRGADAGKQPVGDDDVYDAADVHTAAPPAATPAHSTHGPSPVGDDGDSNG